ncbi:hypothetical protein AL506_000700 [Streptococcus sp. FDAARGOS_146]|uniref:Uncharacterized protein n=1 Tax=Streptococcus constellatus TaxID=76860 RepID=A0A0C1K6Q7_STRCV|nr:hypothetical protein RN79_03135 [Streptococcus constellatus]OFN57818.1 hypothetical protein HMPREF2542_00405 [Streptococcus sp. HMSC034B05]PNM83161.1 hypothetical protein AL506_000700 [Streptococcus sp. FDAARGOS_146]
MSTLLLALRMQVATVTVRVKEMLLLLFPVIDLKKRLRNLVSSFFLCKRSFHKTHLRRFRELAIIMNIRKRFLPQGDNDD